MDWIKIAQAWINENCRFAAPAPGQDPLSTQRPAPSNQVGPKVYSKYDIVYVFKFDFGGEEMAKDRPCIITGVLPNNRFRVVPISSRMTMRNPGDFKLNDPATGISGLIRDKDYEIDGSSIEKKIGHLSSEALENWLDFTGRTAQKNSMVKTAEELGHGNTLNGQYLNDERNRLFKEINKLRTMAATGGPDSVLPRWRPEIRRNIYLLPASTRVPNMSMLELKGLSNKIEFIHGVMKTYSVKRFKEIMGDASNSR